MVGSVITFDGAEMNESPMTPGAHVDELIAVVVEREVAAMSGSLVPYREFDDELIAAVADVECE